MGMEEITAWSLEAGGYQQRLLLHLCRLSPLGAVPVESLAGSSEVVPPLDGATEGSFYSKKSRLASSSGLRWL